MNLATLATYLKKEMITPLRNILPCHHIHVHPQSCSLADEVYVELTSRTCFRGGENRAISMFGLVK